MENISWILSLMISLSMMKTRFCEYQQCSARSIFEPGSAIFGALVDVHHPGPNNAGCGSIAGAQEIEAMKWAVEKINRNGYIPGIKLGKEPEGNFFQGRGLTGQLGFLSKFPLQGLTQNNEEV